MKRKIICLALCVACLFTMLASCGSNPDVCTTHVDADKNSVCDTCGFPVLTIVEKVPTEEEIVNMIVAAIPEGATLGSVYATAVENDLLAGEFEAKENFSSAASNEDVMMLNNRFYAYVYETQTKGLETLEKDWPTLEKWVADGKAEADYKADGWKVDDKFTSTYAVFDVLENKDVISFTTAEYEAGKTEHLTVVTDIDLVNEFFIKVTTRSWYQETNENEDEGEGDNANTNAQWFSEFNDAYYFKNGTLFLDEAKVDEDDEFYAPVFNDKRGDIIYYTVHDVMYAYDFDTCAKLGEGARSTFVKRPEFDYETDALGIVKNGNKFFVYDLTKWIECVYSYEAPANAETFILANGNVLVQQSVILPDSAVNYDYVKTETDYGTGITYSYKCDLVHTVVDVAAKTAANLELGYYVNEVIKIDEGDADEIAAGVKNALIVNTILHKNLDKQLTLACDDALGIIADVEAVNPKFVSDIELVANNVFLGTVVYGEGSYVRKLYNEKGEEIATLPHGAELLDNCILNDGKFYDFTMKLIFDPEAAEKDEDDYSVLRMFDSYLLLMKGADTYYWNATLAAPVMIVDATNVEMVPSEEDPDTLVATTPDPLKVQTLVEFNYTEDYYVVKTTTTTVTKVEGQDDKIEIVDEYVLYNAAGTAILTSDANIFVDTMYVEGELVWSITTDNVIYLAK